MKVSIPLLALLCAIELGIVATFVSNRQYAMAAVWCCYAASNIGFMFV